MGVVARTLVRPASVSRWQPSRLRMMSVGRAAIRRTPASETLEHLGGREGAE